MKTLNHGRDMRHYYGESTGKGGFVSGRGRKKKVVTASSANMEFLRARGLGYKAGTDVLSKKGWAHYMASAQELRVEACARKSDEFDRGYYVGFQDALRAYQEAS